jgi:hypothetical protein
LIAILLKTTQDRKTAGLKGGESRLAARAAPPFLPEQKPERKGYLDSADATATGQNVHGRKQLFEKKPDPVKMKSRPTKFMTPLRKLAKKETGRTQVERYGQA